MGEVYSNDQIHYALEVGNLGGIRPKLTNKKLDYIVLITSSEENKKHSHNPYADKIEGDTLTYTGAGLKGDQTVSGVNKRILEQKDNPIPILGFVKEGLGQYKFIGFLFLLRYYEDYQIDNSRELRKVLIFEFQIYSDIPKLKVGEFNPIFSPFYDKFKTEILPEDTIIDSLTPLKEQEITTSINQEQLKDVEELRKTLLSVDPYDFEVLMSKLVSHTGFKNVEVTKKSGDDGIDINAMLNHHFSFDLSYQFQVKRWKHSVGRKEVANLRGSLGFNSFGVIISTGHFTSSAFREASSDGKVPINLVGVDNIYKIIKDTKFSI